MTVAKFNSKRSESRMFLLLYVTTCYVNCYVRLHLNQDNFTISVHTDVYSSHFTTDQLIKPITLNGQRRLIKLNFILKSFVIFNTRLHRKLLYNPQYCAKVHPPFISLYLASEESDCLIIFFKVVLRSSSPGFLNVSQSFSLKINQKLGIYQHGVECAL